MSPTTDQASAKFHQANQAIASHPIVQQGSAIVGGQMNALDRELAKFGFLNDLEARTKVPKAYGFLGFTVTFFLLIFLNIFGLASPVTNLIGWVLPAYLSCAALESSGGSDDKQWLTYWIVFGFFNFLESAALRVVLYYLPYYFPIKLAFTVWLMLPTTRGAEKVYHSFLRPTFLATQRTAKKGLPTMPAAHTKSPSSATNSNNPFSPTTGSTGFSTATSTGVTSPTTTTAGHGVNIGGVEVPPAAGASL